MSAIDAVTRELLEKTEFLAIVTEGPDGPHVVGNWGDYLRRIGVEGDRIVLPAGHYRETEKNLQRGSSVQVLVASRAVKGTHGPGQGCVLSGTGRVESEGEAAQRAKAAFPWARGALVIEVQSVRMQL
ncbi:MAG: pyridoxamine 5'-phosphate oxidase family protein [Ramlibacter sp.]|nr:pyridoxamine 5'-phosphate oxidase family protein [Ramlibacter sp.]